MMSDTDDSSDVPLAKLFQDRNLTLDEKQSWNISIEFFPPENIFCDRDNTQNENHGISASEHNFDLNPSFSLNPETGLLENSITSLTLSTEKTGYFNLLFSEEDKTPCKLCCRGIRTHRYLTLIDGRTIYGCDVCPAYFTSTRYLLDHKLEYHAQNYQYYCRICTHFFDDPDQLANHVKIHSDVGLETCQLCTKCENPCSKEEKSGKIVNNVCVYCKKSFRSEFLLKKHVEIHKKEQNFECCQCLKKFAKLVQLEKHIRGHKETLESHKENLESFVVKNRRGRPLKRREKFEVKTEQNVENTEEDQLNNFTDFNEQNSDSDVGFAKNIVKNPLKKRRGRPIKRNEKFEVKIEAENAENTSQDEFINFPYFKEQISDFDLGFAKKKDQKPMKKRRGRPLKVKSVKKETSSDLEIEGEHFSCNNCPKSYTKKDHLRIHMHNHFKPLSCPICNQKFAFKTYLRTHLAGHSGEKRFLCHLCGANFTQYGNLQSHLKRHTGNKRFQCHVCPKSFFIRGALKKHIRSHTGEQPFQCPFCSRSFSSSGNMARHKMIHTGEKPYKCTFCEKAFIQSTELKNHLRIHTHEPRPQRPSNNKKYNCTQCTKNFTSSAYLKAHIRVHTGERPYSCNVCEKTFAKISSFSQHRKIHLKVKPYICNFCGKGFSQSGNFNMHLRKHTGEKPYKCQTCGKCFSQPVNLTRHQMVHTGEKRYTCTHCGKRFSQNHALADHINIHTGEKPHKCLFCGSAFANQSTLSRHISIHSLPNKAPVVVHGNEGFENASVQYVNHNVILEFKDEMNFEEDKKNIFFQT